MMTMSMTLMRGAMRVGMMSEAESEEGGKDEGRQRLLGVAWRVFLWLQLAAARLRGRL